MLNQNLSVLGHKKMMVFLQGKFAEGEAYKPEPYCTFFYSKERTDDLHLFHELNLDLKSLNFTEIQIGPNMKLCFETFYDVSYHGKVKHVSNDVYWNHSFRNSGAD